jgi:hypothetical protein
MKLFTNDKTLWVSEIEFLKRYRSRIPDTRIGIYNRYVEKYKKIFSWLCIAFNGKEKFWEILKRDYENNKLDYYEVRLEEIMNTCMSNDRKYWKMQCTIASRRRRTQLFRERLFKHRNDKEKNYCDNFGYRGSSFKHRVLFNLRREIIHSVGHQFYGIEYEERLLYSMAANSELFGTGMTRFNEKQFYKKFLKIIEVPPLERLDVSLMEDFRFYARFLAIYVTKMKKDWIKKDQS